MVRLKIYTKRCLCYKAKLKNELYNAYRIRELKVPADNKTTRQYLPQSERKQKQIWLQKLNI